MIQEDTVERSRQPLVSVITPVYNCERYLAECIESILAQTYRNWEYIIVNNCSTDLSLEIMEGYAKLDSRIHVHNNESFLPIMQNWNHALRQISPGSKYVKVVHADDWLFPECLMKMVQVAEENPSVAIVGAYRIDDTRVNCDGLPYPSTVVPGKEICGRTLMEKLYVFGSPTTLLIRSSLIRGREKFYNESNFHADTEVCFEILKDADFGYVHQVLSYTRRDSEAMTALARRLNTYMPGHLYMLKKYGPVYLSTEEFGKRWEAKMRDYYRFLGKNVLSFRERQFWEYHKKALEAMECRLERGRLAVVVLLEILDILLNPKSTASRAFRGAVTMLRGRAKKMEVASPELMDAFAYPWKATAGVARRIIARLKGLKAYRWGQ
ncbi:MAG: glycosyltransferase family 2 protein [Alphaproteobacteria bacterium]|uniref:Glycosyltransferase family 2 protein n=1 Tax=Candidatus Nitrobium versatile TaxID=2884831 RepID=A0A953M0D1_9BACT|nr:glycosyltransferase family 2 protein [Candidatus Nitrobium versatile]